MTMREAKEIYLKYDCSYFAMCMKDYTGYMKYRRVEVPKKHENNWKSKKMNLLYRTICENKDYVSFCRMYKIAVDFWDYTHLKILLEALKVLKLKSSMQMKDRVGIAELILGGIYPDEKKGIIYWANELGEIQIVDFLLTYVYDILWEASDTNMEVERRIQRARRLMTESIKKINK